MSSDVEMREPGERDALLDGEQRAHDPAPAPLPPRQPSPAARGDSDAPAPSPPPPPPHSPSAGPSTSGGDDGASAAAAPPAAKKKGRAGAASKPASSAAGAGAKPKSTKPPPRSPSPSPPPPPARPPPQTIRLAIALGGPENYEVDIAALSKQSGQRAPTPAPAKRDSSDDSHSEGDDEGDGKQEKKKRRRKNIAQEYYDVSDPFIDDSELAVDERTFFAQTKQQGFYVSSGQVALLTDKPPPKKPKSRKIQVLPPAQSISAALSTASLPPLSLSTSTNLNTSAVSPNGAGMPAEYGDGDEGGGGASASVPVKRKSEESESAALGGQGSKKKRKVEIRPFHPELEESIEVLKKEIAKENWEVKGKFPQSLKPLLAQVALKAIVLDEYNDNFFNLMPKIFPYNRFTMTKLIKRTVWRDHTELLQRRSAQYLEELAGLAKEGFPKAQEEYERSVAQWEKREKARTEGAHAPSAEGTPVPLPPDDGAADDTGAEHDGGALPGEKSAAGPGARDAHPPTKKYRLSEQIKVVIWQLVCLSNECCRIENEKNQLENNNVVVSDQGVRKGLYQKIVACFPDGWITSGQVSREVSVMKKKFEKDLENE